MDFFHNYIETVLGKDYFSFPYVQMEYSGDQNPFQPQVHILKGAPKIQKDRFRKLIENLLTDTAFDHYRKLDNPQNYQQ